MAALAINIHKIYQADLVHDTASPWVRRFCSFAFMVHGSVYIRSAKNPNLHLYNRAILWYIGYSHVYFNICLVRLTLVKGVCFDFIPDRIKLNSMNMRGCIQIKAAFFGAWLFFKATHLIYGRNKNEKTDFKLGVGIDDAHGIYAMRGMGENKRYLRRQLNMDARR